MGDVIGPGSCRQGLISAEGGRRTEREGIEGTESEDM